MAANQAQLQATVRQLHTFHEMLEAVLVHSIEHDARVFPTLAEGYLKHIAELEKEIVEYTYRLLPETGSEVSVIEAKNSEPAQPMDIR